LSAVNGSCRYVCAANTIRRLLVDTLSIDSEFQTWFRRRFRNPTFSPILLPPLVPYTAASLPSLLTGSLGVVTLLSNATGDAKTASAHLLGLRIQLGTRYLGVLSVLGERGPKRARDPGSW